MVRLLLDSVAPLAPETAMCSRFTLTSSPAAVARLFGLQTVEPFPPRYNIAPTQPILVVHEAGPDPRADRRIAQLARWGLIPGWVREPEHLPLLYAARAETVAERNSFRGALRHRRCLVPASGFYDWRRDGAGGRQAWFLRAEGEAPLAFAGLFETYLAPDGSEIDTAAILSVPAGRDIAQASERSPIVVRGAEIARWLGCRDNEPADVADILVAPPAGTFRAVPVSDRVNAVANMGPEVQEEVSVPPDARGFQP